MICRECGQDKPKSNPHIKGNLCGDCYKAYMRAYWAEHREKGIVQRREQYYRDRENPDFMEEKRKKGREYWRGLRHEAILAYGGYVCACCGEDEPRFMTLDHINNDGAEHRKSIGRSGRGSGIFKWLKENGYPSGFQVLCFNCNCGREKNGGICPYKTMQANGVNSGKTRDRAILSEAPKGERATTIPKGSTAKRPEARRACPAGHEIVWSMRSNAWLPKGGRGTSEPR